MRQRNYSVHNYPIKKGKSAANSCAVASERIIIVAKFLKMPLITYEVAADPRSGQAHDTPRVKAAVEEYGTIDFCAVEMERTAVGSVK
jgi:hypothetical protein